MFFFAWKFNSRTNRNIDINELTAYTLTYNQVEIENYELGLWQRHWTHQCETPQVPLNHKIQMQFRFPRKEVGTFRLISGHCKLNVFSTKFGKHPLQDAPVALMKKQWNISYSSATCSMSLEKNGKFEAPCRKLSKTRT